MSSSKFENFSEIARVRGNAAIADEFVDFLKRGNPGSRWTPQMICDGLGLESSSAAADVEDLIALASSAESGILLSEMNLRCPACGERFAENDIVSTNAGELECPSCYEGLPALSALESEKRYRLTREAGVEATQRQFALDALPVKVAVLVSALPLEMKQVKAEMEVQGAVEKKQLDDGHVVYAGEFVTQFFRWKILAAVSGQTDAAAAATFTSLAKEYDPDVAIFVGIAGGFKEDNIQLGDVVAATIVHEYQVGKSTKQGFEPRPLQHRVSHRLEQVANDVMISGEWQDRIRTVDAELVEGRTFNSYVAPIAAGSQVVASTRSEAYGLIKVAAGRAVAVEMEGAGFMGAVNKSDAVDGIVIRGICDLLDKKDSTWHEQASANAAAFAFELLNGLQNA